MNLSMEELINKVVAAVLAELARRGIKLDAVPSPPSGVRAMPAAGPHSYVVDMSGFKSPVLLERHVFMLSPEIKEIVVPAGTVVTPGARDIIKKKNLKLTKIPTTN
jgi:hypothetical protein